MLNNDTKLLEMINEYIRKNNIGDEVVGFIKKTNNLDKFNSKLEGIENRNLSSSNLKNLTKSMSEKQLIIPATVTVNGEIIDGNHRLAVAKKLGLPYYYYCIDGCKDDRLIANSTMQAWGSKDFLNEHIKRGNEEYIWLKKTSNKCNMTIDALLIIICRTSGKVMPMVKEEFKNGLLIVEDKEFIEMFVNDLSDFSFFPEYKTARFISAFLEMYNHQRYNHATMITSLEKYGKDLVKQVTKKEYLSLLSKIYSKSTKSKIRYSLEFNSFV